MNEDLQFDLDTLAASVRRFMNKSNGSNWGQNLISHPELGSDPDFDDCACQAVAWQLGP